jgi:hypothetical protein
MELKSTIRFNPYRLRLNRPAGNVDYIYFWARSNKDACHYVECWHARKQHRCVERFDGGNWVGMVP